MSLHVIEGTWEEIKLHEAELTGRQLRVTIKPEKIASRKPAASVMGKYAAILSSEDFMREKQEEIKLEDRPRP